MNQVLEASGLCRKKADIFLPTLQAWREFIAKYKIDVELTMFSLGNKRRHFLRVGSFNTMNHPAKMPVFYWRERVEPPKLRINKVTSIFALSIGQLNLTFDDEGSRMEIESESSDSSSDESESEPSSADNVEVDGDNTSARLELTTAELNLPDPNKFPLLNSLSYNPMNMDRLMQEILLFHGNKQINFTRGNTRKGSLIILPSHLHLECYEAELSKRNSAIDTIVDIIAESCKSSKEEAAECLLKSIFSKYENSFVSVAIDKCLMKEKIEAEEKMDVVSTEAMIQEANISTNSARIINRHLRQHFGQSLFASEAERSKYFAGSDFPPTVSTKVLEDKTIIPFWFKRPDLYLQSQFKDMIDHSLLKDIIRVDLIIGGDHGGGKFRMTMKVNFRLPGKKTVSYLTQIASVSYSKDKTEILR
jgi:hypothetical protein